MNRRKLERHLTSHNCFLRRHGGSHDGWSRRDAALYTSVPRHNEIDPGLVRSICRDLGIPPPAEK